MQQSEVGIWQEGAGAAVGALRPTSQSGLPAVPELLEVTARSFSSSSLEQSQFRVHADGQQQLTALK